MSFDFGAAVAGDDAVEAWHPASLDVLPKGNYVLKITEVDNTRSNNSNAYPMLKLRLESAVGVQWDNVVISPSEFSVQKLLGLIDSAGLARPVPGTDIDEKDGKLSEAFASKLIGKMVGVIVRDEEDNRPDHIGEFRPRVKGYRPPEEITETAPETATKAADPVRTTKAEEVPF
jgi:hypothetical protein